MNRVLGLKDDLLSFYREYSSEKEPLSCTFRDLKGPPTDAWNESLRESALFDPVAKQFCEAMEPDSQAPHEKLW